MKRRSFLTGAAALAAMAVAGCSSKGSSEPSGGGVVN
jgi:multiple sugar transport system substrate-binding protein